MMEDEPAKSEQITNWRNEHVKSIQIILKRCKGELSTTATWLRNFVLQHPLYQKDSIVPPVIDARLA
jgi:hypothetical protein